MTNNNTIMLLINVLMVFCSQNAYSMLDDKKTHCYYFVFTDGSGEKIRFPATATLTTGNESSCSASSNCGKGRTVGHRTSLHNSGDPSSTYTLNGVKIIGKLAVYRYAYGVHCNEKTGLVVNKW